MEEQKDLSQIPKKDDQVDLNLEPNQTACKNCSKTFELGFQFCPHCGQKAKDDLTIGVLFYNTISNYFSFDARFFRSFIPLMFRPGYVARQFVLGKRLQYLHPAQYYLFVSVVFFFLFSIEAREHTQAVDQALQKGFQDEISTDSIPVKPLDSVSKAKISENIKRNQKLFELTDQDAKDLDSILTNVDTNATSNLTFSYDRKKVDSLIAVGAPEMEQLKAMGMNENAGFFTKRFYQQLLKFQKQKGGGILQAFYDSIPIALFFLLPIFAIILKVFYWRKGRFAHHLVFSFYYFSYLFALMSIVLAINYFWDMPDWLDIIIILSTFIYLWLAVRHFYKQGFLLSLIKSGLVTFVYFIFVIPIAIVVMVVGSFLFY